MLGNPCPTKDTTLAYDTTNPKESFGPDTADIAGTGLAFSNRVGRRDCAVRALLDLGDRQNRQSVLNFLSAAF
jgi:hypothetical protein